MFSLSDESESKPDTYRVDSLPPLKIIRYYNNHGNKFSEAEADRKI